MHIPVLMNTAWERKAEVSHQDMSRSAMLLPVSAVVGSGGSRGPVLAQCFWLKLGAKVACVSGLVLPVPLVGVGSMWLSGVWLNALSTLGRF